MTERRYTDENDQPLTPTPVHGPEFLRAITDLLHGDTTISAAIELVRSHPEHSHSFPTNTGLIVHIPALSPATAEEDIEATLSSMMATLRNDLLEDMDDKDNKDKTEPTNG